MVCTSFYNMVTINSMGTINSIQYQSTLQMSFQIWSLQGQVNLKNLFQIHVQKQLLFVNVFFELKQAWV